MAESILRGRVFRHEVFFSQKGVVGIPRQYGVLEAIAVIFWLCLHSIG